MSLIEQHRQTLGTAPLCQALKVPRASFYRQQSPKAAAVSLVTRKPPEHALSKAERQTVLATLHEPRFVDLAPPQVYARLLEEGRYLCSIRTMYRLLEAHQEVRERRAVASRVVYAKPELLAIRPNEVWSWDITKLLDRPKCFRLGRASPVGISTRGFNAPSQGTHNQCSSPVLLV